LSDTETRPVLCGKCHVAIEQRANPETQTILAVCPNCGETDTLDNAVREAGEYWSRHYFFCEPAHCPARSVFKGATAVEVKCEFKMLDI
jgi:hypothetical protein